MGNYVWNLQKIKIKCNDCDSIFLQDHINKKTGCPNCNLVGSYNEDLFKIRPELKNKSAKLYFVKFWNDNEEFYKVGITINQRGFKHKKKYKTKILNEFKTNIYNVWIEEQKVIKKYKYKPIHKFEGHTECFSKEIYKAMFPNN